MSIYDINGNELDISSGLDIEARMLGLHLMPASRGELNIVKRARQFTDIKWTPSATVKRKNAVEYDDGELDYSQGWQDSFTAGVEYTGLPYSHGYYNGANRNFAMIGYQVSLDAFATSVLFPESYFSAVNAWDETNAVYTPYGISCDTLACYAMGLDTWYGSSAGFQTLVNNGVIVSQFSGDDIDEHIDDIHLGDILWKKDVHVAIITDVVTEGDNIYIEVSEATTRGAAKPDVNGTLKGGVARRELWDLETFFTRFYGYTVYRYANSANVTYTQSPYVTLQGETPLHTLRDRIPLIPYMGDNFKYLSGHIPNSKILIASDEYAYLAVYKDGALFNTFTIGSADNITVGFSSVGAYEAFLYNSTDGTIANMTNRTVSCRWSVVN